MGPWEARKEAGPKILILNQVDGPQKLYPEDEERMKVTQSTEQEGSQDEKH